MKKFVISNAVRSSPNRMTKHLTAAGVLCAVVLALHGIPGHAKDRADEASVDMDQWYRRDWHECKSATKFNYFGNTVQITSEQSTGLIWQIPTVNNTPMVLDRESNAWLEDCERPPRSLNSEISERGVDDLIEVSEFRYVSWRWKVDYATMKDQQVEQGKKLKSKYDDFPAKFGITIQRKGSSSIREVAYIWSKTLPEDRMFRAETTIIPKIWKLKWWRFVAESGLEHPGTWVPEVRDLYEDYKKAYPGEEPGKILRVYLMTDSDNTKSRVSTWYADIMFHKEAPERPLVSDGDG